MAGTEDRLTRALQRSDGQPGLLAASLHILERGLAEKGLPQKSEAAQWGRNAAR